MLNMLDKLGLEGLIHCKHKRQYPTYSCYKVRKYSLTCCGNFDIFCDNTTIRTQG